MDDESSLNFPAARTATRRPPCPSSNNPSSQEQEISGSEVEGVYCDHLIELFCIKLSDGLDHPAIWNAWPDFVKGFPLMPGRLAVRLSRTKAADDCYVALRIGRAMCQIHNGDSPAAQAELESLQSELNASALIQGVLQYIHSRAWL